MASFKKFFSSERNIILTFSGILLIGLVILGFYLAQFSKIPTLSDENLQSSTVLVKKLDIKKEEEKKVEFADGENVKTDGLFVPEGIDLEAILPDIPATAKLLNVTDNKQPGSRSISILYNINRSVDGVKKQILNDIDKKFEYLEESSSGMIYAKKDKYKITISVDALSKDESLITIIIDEEKV